ncbi:MAG: prepilin peptidase [Candidatus Dadabacteria bacterium]|nr:MAG: prepilin peptidase [Candidatus Dadabacteria bacterium]
MLTYIFLFVFGLIIGSFLTVCIYRIPYGREKGVLNADEQDIVEEEELPKEVGIGRPIRSFCPECRHQLAWYCNIPLFSWIALRGRCHYCKNPIPFRYPLVEILSALACCGAYYFYGLTLTAFIVYAFVAALIVISFIDIDYYIIPNVISIPGFFLGLILALLNQYFHFLSFPVVPGIKDALLGVLFGAGFLLLISEVYLRLRKKEGLGMGDVKLLAMTGAFFGPQAALYTIFVGSLLGSVLGVLIILLGGKSMSHQLPFGPYLAAGNILYLFGGVNLIAAIFRLG